MRSRWHALVWIGLPVLFSLAVACPTVHPPTPPVPPIPSVFGIGIGVYDTLGHPLPNIAVASDRPPTLTVLTDAAGQTILPGFTTANFNVCAFTPLPDHPVIVAPQFAGQIGGRIGVCAPVSAPVNQNLVFTFAVPPPGPPPITTPRTAVGPLFYRSGAPVRWKGISAFVAMRAFDQGGTAALDPYIAYSHTLGVNTWRVFLQHYNMDLPAIEPYTAPIGKVRPFADYLASQGLDVEFTVLADNQLLGYDAAWQAARLAQVITAVATAPNVALELCNEPFANGCDVYALATTLNLWSPANRPVPMALGDYTIVGNETGFRWLDYITNHAERKPTWPTEAVKTAHFINDGWGADANSPGFRGAHGVPVIEDEPPHVGTDNPGYETSVDNVREGFAGFSVGAAGATFHSTEALHFTIPLPGSVSDTLGRAALAAMDFCPTPAIPAGLYWHDGIANGPVQSVGADPTIVGEVSGRTLNGLACVVAAQPSPRWVPVPTPGWTVLTRTGTFGGDLLTLTQ